MIPAMTDAGRGTTRVRQVVSHLVCPIAGNSCFFNASGALSLLRPKATEVLKKHVFRRLGTLNGKRLGRARTMPRPAVVVAGIIVGTIVIEAEASPKYVGSRPGIGRAKSDLVPSRCILRSIGFSRLREMLQVYRKQKGRYRPAR